MKSKTLIGILSAMVFVAVLVMAGAVALILFLGAQKDNDSPAVNIANNAQSQVSEDEFLYLLDNQSQQGLRINLADGRESVLDLGLDARTIYLSGKAFSSDNRLIAYCVVERITDETVRSRFIVRELATGRNLIEQDLGSIPRCEPSAFSPDNSRVVVSYVYNSPIENSNNFPDKPNWSLDIVDVNTASVVQSLNEDSPTAPNFGALSEYWFEPTITPAIRVIHYAEDYLFMVAFPFVGRDGPPALPAFRWDFATNAVTFIEGLGNNGATILPQTGEIAYPYLNPAYEASQPIGPVALANELRISDANGTRVVYRDTQNTIASVSFLNGGRQLAILLLPAGEPTANDIAPSRHIILNRDGTLENLNSPSIYGYTLIGTNNGFLSFSTEWLAEGTTYQLLRHQAGQTITIWSFVSQTEPRANYEILGTSPMTVAENLSAFPSVD